MILGLALAWLVLLTGGWLGWQLLRQNGRLLLRLEELEKRRNDLEVVMISKGEPKENRAKVKEHGLTFLIILQQQWEISRRYARFATPIAYLIDEAGSLWRT